MTQAREAQEIHYEQFRCIALDPAGQTRSALRLDHSPLISDR
jgi:hypothetical protein